jgi:phosphonate transport system substrate-binding protein
MQKFILTTIILLLPMIPVSANPTSDASYTISFVPQHSPKHLLKIWGPVVSALSKETGVKLKLRIDKSIPAFESKLENEAYDFSYMNPYHYSLFHEKGYEAIAKAKDKKIQGIFVTKIDSDINSLEDLKGMKVAFPSPNAFAATLLTEAALKAADIEFDSNYVQSHDSVYGSVNNGQYVTGGGIKRTFNVFISENPDHNMKILWQSRKFTPHAFTHHRRVPKEVVMKITNALLSMDLAILRAAKIKSGFMPAIDTDWDDVRALKIIRQ